VPREWVENSAKNGHNQPSFAGQMIGHHSKTSLSFFCIAISFASGDARAQAQTTSGRERAQRARPPGYCLGEYADDFSALGPRAREREQKQETYTFCIRAAATYECPSYGQDGNLKRSKRQVIAHGTAFGYQRKGETTLLATNEHVVEWPLVTTREQGASNVPHGCKRVAQTTRIVDNENDHYEGDDLLLSPVTADATLDIAILRANKALPVMPWKLGKSSKLRERNIVDVRGFPLGVFKATNVGKVVSAYDHDEQGEWNHDDFVIDALLSEGNSGSPVFAISCKTREFELVGMYHAGYTEGSALNVVVGIDQIRDVMMTLKPKPRSKSNPDEMLDASARSRLTRLSELTLEPFFPFGQVPAAVRAHPDGRLFFEIIGRDFPMRSFPVVLIEDLPPGSLGRFGEAGRVWLGNEQGLKVYERDELDKETAEQVERLHEALRRTAVIAFAARAVDTAQTRENFERRLRLEKRLKRVSARYVELAQTALELAEKGAPRPGQVGVSLLSILKAPGPAALQNGP
jgi:serine protease Do